MELYKNTRVQFFEDPHEYLLDGVIPLIGVTSLMKKHGLAPDYGGVDEETLAHAAALGSMAHQVIENFCNGLPTVEIPLLTSFKKLGLNIIATEYLVSDNETTASKVDLVEAVDETSVVLWDVKRTSSVHRKPLAWQLGIYKYLVEKANPAVKVVGCKCLPVKKGDKDNIDRDTCGTPVDITPVPAEEVEKLLACEAMGMAYEAPAEDVGDLAVLLTKDELTALGDAYAYLAEVKVGLDAANNLIKEMEERAYRYMLENNMDKLSNGKIEFTLKRPYNTTKFDATKFKKDHPEISNKYMRTSETKGNVTIKVL